MSAAVRLGDLPSGAVFRWSGVRFRLLSTEPVSVSWSKVPRLHVQYLDSVRDLCREGEGGLMCVGDLVEPLTTDDGEVQS